MEIKNRQKVLLIAAGVGLLLLIGNSVVYEPLVASWKARSERIDDLREQVDKGERMLKSAASIDRQWDRMRTNALPAVPSLAESQMLKSFDRWERASGITRASIKPQWKEADVTDYLTVEYRADYTGDIARILSYLYEVEHDPTGLRVDNVEISSQDSSGQQLSLGLQVSGLVLNPEQPAQQP